jgi:hypothetical protein
MITPWISLRIGLNANLRQAKMSCLIKICDHR